MNNELKIVKLADPKTVSFFLALCWRSDAQAWAGTLHTAR